MNLTTIFESVLEPIINGDTEQHYLAKIREKNPNLLDTLERNPNFTLELNQNMNHVKFGQPNRCETNVYNFIRTKLINGDGDYYPVAGFMFYHDTLTPIEHWWVYNKTNGDSIDPSPLDDDHPSGYVGIINTTINDEILSSKQVFDVDFFKSGFSKFR